MKHYLLLTAVAVAVAAGCTREPVPQGVEETVPAVFRLGMGEVSVKSESDGLKATQLIVGVYDRESGYVSDISIPVEQASPDAFQERHTYFRANLTKGHSYDLVFIAQVPGNPFYTIDLPGKTLTVSTAGAANDEDRDAFYAVYPVEQVDGMVEADIVLRRPFAQVNVVSRKDDFEKAREAEILFERSSLRLHAPTVLHLLDGSVDTVRPYDLSPNRISLHPNYKPYLDDYWIATCYVLSNRSSNLYDIQFSVYKKGSSLVMNTTTVTDVPLRRNYRTTISGNILTAEGSFDIVIDPLYSGSTDIPFNKARQ